MGDRCGRRKNNIVKIGEMFFKRLYPFFHSSSKSSQNRQSSPSGFKGRDNRSFVPRHDGTKSVVVNLLLWCSFLLLFFFFLTCPQLSTSFLQGANILFHGYTKIQYQILRVDICYHETTLHKFYFYSHFKSITPKDNTFVEQLK